MSMIWYFLPVSFGKFVAFPLEILFFLCGHEKNNFPRLLTCNTVENGVPIDESGAQQQHSSLVKKRETEKRRSRSSLTDDSIFLPPAGSIVVVGSLNCQINGRNNTGNSSPIPNSSS
jgi:hypothetical protein